MKTTLDIVTQALSEQAEGCDASGRTELSGLCRSLLIRMRRIANDDNDEELEFLRKVAAQRLEAVQRLTAELAEKDAIIMRSIPDPADEEAIEGRGNQ